MPRRSDAAIIEELLDRFDEHLKAAFLDAIADIRDNITLRVVVERLEKGDVSGAIEAMHLDADAFAKLEMAIREAYNSGGQATVANLPRLTDPQGNRVVFRFGVRNLEAETWLRDHSSQLVSRVVDDQRVAIRTALTEGLEQGQNPRSTALNVIGRISRQSNRREGGIIGLSAAQERYVANAREELASGDPARLQAFLGRERRDKRFDRTIAKAIREEKPLDQEMINRIVGRYSDRLLELRGTMLARTETMMALHKSRDDAIRQQIDAGKLDARDVTKLWRSAGDMRVRHTHRLLHGKTAPMEGAFQSVSGATLRYPGDPTAPASEIIGCRCLVEYKISFFAAVERRFKARAFAPLAR